MAKTIMIKNNTEFPMSDVYEYLAGFTTKLGGKIEVEDEFGQNIKGEYHDILVVKNI